ncbi:hypothetical protein [Lederbergia citrea]|uniref:hypothetical protein n=1 Tax=Lederbergia citrea TaxID=2833581 RepID=UPI001BCA4178|nr:hypothetical protein [Lederbergia citrea]MBS4176999.1 hypothetical protein [Lederbergia citrea]MBS4203572.1 hypothetical protein [Lederbergia citrea]
MEIYFYGFFGLILLFLIITYAVRLGIDTSKQVQNLRSELKEMKKQIKDLEKNKS